MVSIVFLRSVRCRQIASIAIRELNIMRLLVLGGALPTDKSQTVGHNGFLKSEPPRGYKQIVVQQHLTFYRK